MDIKLTLIKTSEGSLSEDFMRLLKTVSEAGCFVETGTYLGRTVTAMRKVFDKVISIELSDELYEKAKDNFKDDEKVLLLHGDSASKISLALELVGRDKSVLWLDAHWSGGNTAKANQNTPIIDELNVINDISCEENIILIDDIRYFIDLPDGFDTHEANGGYPRLSTVMNILNSLNGKYRVLIVGDILIALPEAVYFKTNPSDVLLATTKLRIGSNDAKDVLHLEKVISCAFGDEKETILMLPEFYSDSLKYGIGGHFCYWRGLVYENDAILDMAKSDFSLARKCGVLVPKRSWE